MELVVVAVAEWDPILGLVDHPHQYPHQDPCLTSSTMPSFDDDYVHVDDDLQNLGEVLMMMMSEVFRTQILIQILSQYYWTMHLMKGDKRWGR